MRLSRSLVFLALAVLVLPVAGCSSDVNPVKATFIEAGYGPKPVETPDFVEKSRRQGAGYLPVGEDAPKRPNRARSAEGQKALEAELEGARGRNEARGRAAASAAKGAGQGLKPNAAPVE